MVYLEGLASLSLGDAEGLQVILEKYISSYLQISLLNLLG
jgi:hypothetical protein